jgi:hypothetical protein
MLAEQCIFATESSHSHVSLNAFSFPQTNGVLNQPINSPSQLYSKVNHPPFSLRGSSLLSKNPGNKPLRLPMPVLPLRSKPLLQHRFLILNPDPRGDQRGADQDIPHRSPYRHHHLRMRDPASEPTRWHAFSSADEVEVGEDDDHVAGVRGVLNEFVPIE